MSFGNSKVVRALRQGHDEGREYTDRTYLQERQLFHSDLHVLDRFIEDIPHEARGHHR